MLNLYKQLVLGATMLSLTVLLSGCLGQTKTVTPATVPAALPSNSQPEAQTPAPAAPAAVTPAPTPAPTPAVSSQTVSVSIQNFAFNPSPVKIKVGDSVVWTNDDPAPHAIKAAGFNSATLNTGDAFKFKFTAAGTYAYGCAIHPSMSGQVIVE